MKETIRMPGTTRGLIFDCDGTLVDSMTLHMDAWKYAFDKYNAPYDREFLFSLKGMKETDIIRTYNTTFNINLDPGQMVAAKHLYFNEHIHQLKPINKIVEVAKNHYGHMPMAVVSGSRAEIVHMELKVVGIFDLFDTIITADDPFKPKPDPQCFLEAAKQLEVNPGDVVVFEDGESGVQAAKKAGMYVINVDDLA